MMTTTELLAKCRENAGGLRCGPNKVRCVVLGHRPMLVDERDKSLAPHLVAGGVWEPWITVAIMDAIKPGDRFLDVGANFGWYCLVAAEAGAEVVAAVEPSPRVADLLEETLAANSIAAPVMRRAAWGVSGEVLRLEQDPENFGGMSVVADRCERVDVESLALDDMADLLGELDVVKIDVEGSEMAAWRGARKLLSRPGIRVFLEFTPCSHKDPVAELQALRDDGFTVEMIVGEGRAVPVDDQKLALDPNWVMLKLSRPALDERVAPSTTKQSTTLAPRSVPAAKQVPSREPATVAQIGGVGRPRLLWIGDAVKKTGFATVAHCVLEHLRKAWDVHVLGINHTGDPHPWPYPIWPAGTGGDMWGCNRLEEVVAKVQPDAVIVNNDPWVVAGFIARWYQLGSGRPPLAAYMPIDMPGMVKAQTAAALSQLDMAVFYTQFGAAEARRAGYRGDSAVVPHGVNLSRFHPEPRGEARKKIGLAPIVGDAFLVGNINRNQPRKRLDLTLRAFADWRREKNPDAWLYIHAAPIDVGWDLAHLSDYYGVADRVLYPTRIEGTTDEAMRSVYCALDVQLTTTLGEGWGLTQLEGVACGIPQIAPQWSALGEWLTRGAVLVPCSDTVAMSGPGPSAHNGIGGVVDVSAVVCELDALYRHAHRRVVLGREAAMLAQQPEYRWSDVAEKIDAALRIAIEVRQAKAA